MPSPNWAWQGPVWFKQWMLTLRDLAVGYWMDKYNRGYGKITNPTQRTRIEILTQLYDSSNTVNFLEFNLLVTFQCLFRPWRMAFR